jgi:hypothetical protein
MNPLHHIFTELNESSQCILDEIGLDEPSFEIIKTNLNRREELVQLLGVLEKSNPKESLTEREQKDLRSLFNNFSDLNKRIQQNLSELLSLHKERLGTVMNERKIEKQYHVLKNPDISYF